MFKKFLTSFSFFPFLALFRSLSPIHTLPRPRLRRNIFQVAVQKIFLVIFVGTLRSDDGDGSGNKNFKQATKNNNSARDAHSLYISLPSLHDCDTKCLISRFMEDVNKPRRKCLSLPELARGTLELNSKRVRLHLIKKVS